MTAPDFMPDPETRAEKAQAYRAAARMRGAGAVFEALRTRRGPFAAFYDTAAVLAFESAHPSAGGRKEELIRSIFGVTAARYQQRLYYLIHDDEAEARRIDAQTVNRLLGLERARAAARLARTQGATTQ